MRLYDAQHNRLVYSGQPATDAFWTDHWQQGADINRLFHKRSDPLIPRLTRRYLPQPKGIRVIDGGCGVGQHVARLQRIGYEAYGVDFARSVVERVQKLRPDLNILYGDVRHLPFPDEFFHGYWSIGVIEHFFQGYGKVADEMHRVLKPGGFLFLTFPHLSALRRYKAKRGHYQPFQKHAMNDHQFYQFALNASRVLADFERRGFRLRYQTQTDGLKGLKDEVPKLKPSLQRLYDSPSLIARVAKVAVSQILMPVTGHSAVLVLQKKSRPQ